MNGAKIQLSSAEMKLVTDTEWILTKNSIITRLVEGLAGLSESYRPIWEGAILPGGPYPCGPKVSKGENYKGLPWIVLDYPRLFGREDVLAVRTLFWWGHYFSVTLHLKGHYKDLLLPALRARLSLLADAGFHICVSSDEWRHELATDNYVALAGIDAALLEAVLMRTGFLKFSCSTPLCSGGVVEETLLRLYATVITVISSL
jgi:hypothetical protein